VKIGYWGILAAAVLQSGCAGMMAQRNTEMDRLLSIGDYRGAAMLGESRLGYRAVPDGGLPEVTFKRANVLDHLDAAEAWRLAGDRKRAAAHYDAAEEALKDVELQGAGAAGAKQLGAVLLNDSVLDYVPSPAEAILINYYKSLAFLAEGDRDNARVELNRADDRTRRAVERYEAEILAAQAAEGAAQYGYANPAVGNAINGKFPEFNQWAPYREFIVPPATYLQALFLARSKDPSDRQRGAELYRRVAGLVEGNDAVAQDAREAAAGRLCPTNRCSWILIEHGLGPVLEERRMDLTVPTLTNGLLTVSFALPALVSRTQGAQNPPFGMQLDAETLYAQPLADMDRVIQTEFQRRFPGIATRAVASATVKAVAQKAMSDSGSQYAPVMNLFANVLTIATTAADTRSWRSMPGRFSLVRIAKTGKPQTLRLANGTYVVPVELPAKGSQLVHIKSVAPESAPTVEVIDI
jgi:hypothetical protein